MKKIVIIGGTGAGQLFSTLEWPGLPEDTPCGQPSSAIVSIEQEGYRSSLGYLARHGPDGSIPPHRVNYRANLWSIHQYEADFIVGLNAVGGIRADAVGAKLVFPDQLIDYTWGREQSYSDGELTPLQHVDFTVPFDPAVRARLIDCATEIGLGFVPSGTYGVTQGPRLETAAEIDRLERDGCDIVGMTAMPEAALARELRIPYAVCAIVVNRAAGRSDSGDDIHAEMERHIERGMAQVGRLLRLL